MLRTSIILVAMGLAAPALAATEAEKQAECAFTAELMGAVQSARLDRVRKSSVSDTLMAENPDWPEGVAQALPAVTEYVYSIRRRDLRQVDLAEQWQTTCLQNYDQIQSMTNSAGN